MAEKAQRIPPIALASSFEPNAILRGAQLTLVGGKYLLLFTSIYEASFPTQGKRDL